MLQKWERKLFSEVTSAGGDVYTRREKDVLQETMPAGERTPPRRGSVSAGPCR